MRLIECKNYKDYLNKKLDELDGSGRGSRTRLTRYVGCQTAYTTQVLRGSAHFSLEQSESVNEFLGHSEDEGYLFLLLVQYARAGTSELKNRFEVQIKKMVQSMSTLKGRLGSLEELTIDKQPIYYSSWVYAAIHAIVSIQGFQSPTKISAELGVSVQFVNQVVGFLITSGVLKRDRENNIVTGKSQIHLGADSPFITQHHLNWRLRAMRAIEADPSRGLFYSSVISISNKDRNLIKNKIIEALKDIKEITKTSKEEDLCSFSLDFFSLMKFNPQEV